MRDRFREATRARPIALAIFAAAAVLASALILLGTGERESLDLGGVAASATPKAAPGFGDPLAWNPDRRRRFEQRASVGLSHVLYEKSPGGIVASAARTARWRDAVERAAAAHGVDADSLEGVILLESAGRPDAMAAPGPDGAVGLAQILPSTATDLLGMEVNLRASEALTRAIAKAAGRSKGPLANRLERKRALIDQRYDPRRSIEGAARYLEIAGERFGDPQLAVVSYHMGIGNLESVIADYTDALVGANATRQLVASQGLSYAQLYFDSSPTRHRAAWERLSSLGDDSATYLWRVLAAGHAMSLYRDDRPQLERLNELETAKASLEEVFHPEGSTEIFSDGDAIESALGRGELIPLPDEPALGFAIEPQMGELAPKLDRPPQLYRALRPEALAALTYIGAKVEAISRSKRPLRVTSAVRDREYQDLLIGVNGEASTEYSLHTTGYSFDVLRRYASDSQAAAFQFVLDRMRALGMLDYAYEPAAIHITASGAASELVSGG